MCKVFQSLDLGGKILQYYIIKDEYIARFLSPIHIFYGIVTGEASVGVVSNFAPTLYETF